jgi:hypothetical protein
MPQPIALITATGGRPLCLSMLAKVMARRIRQCQSDLDVLWVVVDDGGNPGESQDIVEASGIPCVFSARPGQAGEPAHTLPLQLAHAAPLAQGRPALFIEDDDYYHDGWLDACASALRRGVDVFGEPLATYYNASLGAWRAMGSLSHASLAATAVSARALEAVARRCRELPGNPSVDLWLWREAARLGLATELKPPRPRLLTQFKGMPGRPGTLASHAGANYGYTADPGLAMLRTLVDAEDYAEYAAVCGAHGRARTL